MPIGLFKAGLLKVLCLFPVSWEDFSVEDLGALVMVFDGLCLSESVNKAAEGTESAVSARVALKDCFSVRRSAKWCFNNNSTASHFCLHFRSKKTNLAVAKNTEFNAAVRCRFGGFRAEAGCVKQRSKVREGLVRKGDLSQRSNVPFEEG